MTAAEPTRGDVLVVDDESMIRRVASRLLTYLGFGAVCMPDGQSALAALESSPDRFCLVLLDISMPGIDGVETLKRLRVTHPNLPVLIATGHVQDEAAERLKHPSYSGFAPKPYTREHLADAVNRALA